MNRHIHILMSLGQIWPWKQPYPMQFRKILVRNTIALEGFQQEHEVSKVGIFCLARALGMCDTMGQVDRLFCKECQRFGCTHRYALMKCPQSNSMESGKSNEKACKTSSAPQGVLLRWPDSICRPCKWWWRRSESLEKYCCWWRTHRRTCPQIQGAL